MPHDQQNSYEMLAREKKVRALTETMHAHGWADTAIVRAMGPEHWATVAKTAGVKAPSEETIRLVIESLERSRRKA